MNTTEAKNNKNNNKSYNDIRSKNNITKCALSVNIKRLNYFVLSHDHDGNAKNTNECYYFNHSMTLFAVFTFKFHRQINSRCNN